MASRQTSTQANFAASGNAQVRRVYSQNPDLAAQLTTPGVEWKILPLPDPFPTADIYPSVVVADHGSVFSTQLRAAIEQDSTRVLYVLDNGAALPPESHDTPIFGFLMPPWQSTVATSLIAAAFDNLILSRRQAKLEQELQSVRAEIDRLNQIGIALSSQRDTKALMDMILQKSREITNSDAGSLYLVEETDSSEKFLRFKISQNDSIPVHLEEFAVPISVASIAGYVALTGEELHLENVYDIAPTAPFHFNPDFDRESGYPTRSMLAVPMKNPHGEIIGVVQLINCKRDVRARLTSQTVERQVIAFPEAARALVRSLASQAAVAIENNSLYESIQTLFEGFVKASVSAIEARDPTTFGHSFRVADLTVGLAEAVARDDSPAFRDIRFSRAEMKEIRYASLLHDFGKVGVREEVLVKAKKLYPHQLEIIRQRFDYARKALQHEQTERNLNYLLDHGKDNFGDREKQFQETLEERLQELDEVLELILQCNEPTVLTGGNFQCLQNFTSLEFLDSRGRRQRLLTPDELQLLSIPKGSLDDHERKQIESHVLLTLNFLSQIPWTKEIKNIPTIASAHHEKLNGVGYPANLTAARIPFQSKMLTISDIYDALSASDRPYKKAISLDRTLDILAEETKQGLIDAELFRLFRQAEIFKLTFNWQRPSI